MLDENEEFNVRVSTVAWRTAMPGKNHRKRITRLENLRVNQPQKLEVLRRQSLSNRVFELIRAVDANSPPEFTKVMNRVKEQYPESFEEFKPMALSKIQRIVAEKICELDEQSVISWKALLAGTFGDQALLGIAETMVAGMSQKKVRRSANDLSVSLWAVMEFLKDAHTRADASQQIKEERETFATDLDEVAALITQALEGLC